MKSTYRTVEPDSAEWSEMWSAFHHAHGAGERDFEYVGTEGGEHSFRHRTDAVYHRLPARRVA